MTPSRLFRARAGRVASMATASDCSLPCSSTCSSCLFFLLVLMACSFFLFFLLALQLVLLLRKELGANFFLLPFFCTTLEMQRWGCHATNGLGVSGCSEAASSVVSPRCGIQDAGSTVVRDKANEVRSAHTRYS